MTIQHEVRGQVGILTLDRLKALNALDQDMIYALQEQLYAWANDPEVKAVLVRGAGEKGLCAGGDVASLYHDAKQGGSEGAEFWKSEYELNYLISEYPKPYVALMHGIVLGGGVGVSAHGDYRIVTDDSRVGMPEVGIGYSPDAGGSYLLSKTDLGKHLAYTASHVGAAEAIATGFADYYVPQDKLEEFVEEFIKTADPEVVKNYAAEPAPAFDGNADEIAQAYSGDSVEDNLHALDELAEKNDDEHWAAKAAKRIRRNSPLGVKVTQQALKQNQGKSLAAVLEQEFWMSINMQRHPEFVEGIRAQIIDKDRKPNWTYDETNKVPADLVDDIFEAHSDIQGPDFDAVNNKLGKA